MAELPNYVTGACPNCGRHRLMPHFADDETEESGPTLLGIECEKCLMCWPMNEGTGEYANQYGSWPHPIMGDSADKQDEERENRLLSDDPVAPEEDS